MTTTRTKRGAVWYAVKPILVHGFDFLLYVVEQIQRVPGRYKSYLKEQSK